MNLKICRLVSWVTLFCFFGVQTGFAQQTFSSGVSTQSQSQTPLGDVEVKSNDLSVSNNVNYNNISQMAVQGALFPVHVLGNVTNPGFYRLTPASRLTDAISAAGGILESGSKRTIQIRRNGEPTKIYDLFLYTNKGSADSNPFLTDGDVVYVPTKKGSFEIEGAVNRPGTYEITRNLTLSKAIQVAEGLTKGYSEEKPIRVIRYDSEEKPEYIDVYPSDKKAVNNFKIKAGDVIVVSHIFLKDKTFDYKIKRIPGDNIFYPTINDKVYVIGSVNTAGAQTFHPNLSYKDYVNMAGPLNNSRLKGLKVITSDGKKKRLTKSYIVNAGDTIIVPEKAITATNALTWITAIMSTTLTSILLVNELKK